MWAKDLMETNVITIRKETPAKEIAELTLKRGDVPDAGAEPGRIA